jgi:hypothetical protein
MIKAIISMMLDSMFGIYYALTSRNVKPTLLAYNVDWFTNCSWVEQLESFKQLDHYITHKF